MKDCYPDQLFDITKLRSLLPDVRRNLYDTLHTLAMQLCRKQNNEKRAQQRMNQKVRNDAIDEVLKHFTTIQTSKPNIAPSTVNKYLKNICDAIMTLFDCITRKFNVCGISYFVKYAKKFNNIFYHICEPIFDQIFCEKYNKMIKDRYSNPEHQIYLAIARVAAHLTWSQTDKINDMVAIFIYACIFKCF